MNSTMRLVYLWYEASLQCDLEVVHFTLRHFTVASAAAAVAAAAIIFSGLFTTVYYYSLS